MNVSPGMKKYFLLGSILSALCLAGDVFLSSEFGLSISFLMMIVVAVISLSSGLLPTLAAYFYLTSARPLAYVLAAVWLPAFLFNVVSNMGVATSNRMQDVQKAHLQQATHKEVKKAKQENEDKIKTFAARRADLIEKRGWTAAVPVDVIQAKVDAHPGIKAQIWKRTKQCSDATIPESIAYCQQYAKLKADLAAAKSIAGLNDQIDATERVLANSRETLATTDAGISGTANQSLLYAKWLQWSANPTDSQIGSANEGVGIAAAFVLALIAAAMTFASAWPHLLAAMTWKPESGQPSASAPNNAGSNETGFSPSFTPSARSEPPAGPSPNSTWGEILQRADAKASLQERSFDRIDEIIQRARQMAGEAQPA